MPSTPRSKLQEVAFGVGKEADILRYWARLSKYATGVTRWMKGPEFAPFDFAGFDKELIPLTYVEVKFRRSKWGKFPDVIFPMVKHDFGLRLARNSIALIGVTLYSCGTVVEVDLADKPSYERTVERYDRPGVKVQHGVWELSQLHVFLPAGARP